MLSHFKQRKRKASFDFPEPKRKKMTDVPMASNERTLTARKRNKQGWQRAKVLRMPGVSNQQRIYGFPDSITTQLRYFEEFNLTSTTGGISSYLWRANSIYDPNYSGTGHQPLYRDEFALIYDHYTVIASKIIVRWMNASTSPFIVSLGLDDDTTPTTNAYTKAEMNHSTIDSLTPLTGSKSHSVQKCYWGSKSVLAIDPYFDGEGKTPMGQDPLEESFFVCTANTPDASTNTIRGSVEIIYSVKFSELRTPTQS